MRRRSVNKQEDLPTTVIRREFRKIQCWGDPVTFFRDLSVRSKLFGGFGVVLVLTVVLGVVLIVEMGNVNAGGQYLGVNALPSVEAVARIDRDVVDYRRAQLRYILETDPKLEAKEVTAWTNDDDEIQSLLAKHSKLVSNASDARLLAAAKTQWTAYKQLTQAKVLAIGKGAANTALALPLVHASDADYQQLSATLQTWLADNIHWAGERLSGDASTYSSAQMLAILLLAAAVALGVVIALLVPRSIKRGVDVVLDRLRSLQDHCMSYVCEGLEAFARGDLTRTYEPVTDPIPNPSKDEIGQVGTAVNNIREKTVASLNAYNHTRENLSEIVGKVAGSAGEVRAASQEMASTSEQSGRATGEIAHAVGGIAQGAERQAKVVEQARCAAEEVGRAVTEASDTAQKAAEVAREAREVAQQGVAAAEQANEAMRSVRDSSAEVNTAIQELAAKSDQIGEIVQTITGIAEQTNLLALNAAIEAARAGEQGRGFAVVAEEVRKLAEEAQQAAQQISALIGAIQTETGHAVEVVENGAKRTQDGAGVVEQTRAAFQRIDQSVEDMTSRIEQIAAVSEEIAASADSMHESIVEVATVAEESSASTEQVSASTEQTSASAEQISASAQELAGNAESLDRLVAQFKLAS